MNPSGVHEANPTVPPARVTRTISSAVRWWSGANMLPKTDSVASNASSGIGSLAASPSRNSTSSPSAKARARPSSSSSGT